ncbi:molybdenum cofactor guanylyltransferase [Peterkaempfera sp. SMS 1(5)a]|uniref:molybdenum cofactor guanylyltransferase n=1 Tax=Peterkaempfera podocarpi TaxID=3232308 RepID=UPI003671AF0D
MQQSSTGRIAYDVLVLAGGAARRLGGADKPGLRVGESTLLVHVLEACPDAGTTVVVGPVRDTGGRRVHWTREDPPGGGPVAAIAAGLPCVQAPVVALLAADLPFLDQPAVRRLVEALEDRHLDAAVLVDADGREQPLAAAYRAEALRSALIGLLAQHGGRPDGLSLRRLVGGLRAARLPDPDGVAYDCDTWEQVEAARQRRSR